MPDRPRPPLLLVLALLALPQVAETILSPALPALASHWRLDDATSQWTMALFFVGFAPASGSGAGWPTASAGARLCSAGSAWRPWRPSVPGPVPTIPTCLPVAWSGPRPGDLLGDGAGQPARCAARPGVDELFRHARRGAGLVAGSRPPRRPVAGRPRRAPGGVRHPGGAARLAGGAGRPGLAGNPSAAGGHARARDPGDLPTGPGRPPATNARTAGGGAQCAGVLLLRRRAVHGRRPARPGLRLDRPGHRHCREPRRLAQPTPAAHRTALAGYAWA